jgi:hypothetical protein
MVTILRSSKEVAMTFETIALTYIVCFFGVFAATLALVAWRTQRP